MLGLFRQLPQPEGVFKKYPHELSGGQRQRIMIAMALLPEPNLIIADEPATALDVTIQAQILKLLRRLAADTGTAFLFTTHDLGTAYEICDDITGLKPNENRRLRQHLQYSYQDPGASLHPHWKIRRSLHEPLVIHTELNRAAREERVHSILTAVGWPEGHLDFYPHEVSGGQQRRVGLARILTLQPSLVILDEPTSGLDVSVQATILNLPLDLKTEFNLTYLFISHDLSVVRMICNRVAVMYLGKVVEIGETERVFSAPQHPHTQSLLAAVPTIGGTRNTDDFWLEGEPPDPGNLPSGCRFRTRCPHATDTCAASEPVLVDQADGRAAACHLLTQAS